METYHVIVDRYLTPQGVRVEISGFCRYGVVSWGVPHASVQILFAVRRNGVAHILLHKRPEEKRVDGGKWDTFGGHVEVTFAELGTEKDWRDPAFVERLFNQTAARELNEELTVKGHGPLAVHQFGGLGAFETGFDDPASANREHSALYLAGDGTEAPADLTARYTLHDSVERGGKAVDVPLTELDLVPLPELIHRWRREPQRYADGIARILRRLDAEPGFRRELTRFLEELVTPKPS